MHALDGSLGVVLRLRGLLEFYGALGWPTSRLSSDSFWIYEQALFGMWLRLRGRPREHLTRCMQQLIGVGVGCDFFP